MTKVVNNLIVNLENLAKRQYNIEFVQDNYLEWKKEKDEFKKYLNEKEIVRKIYVKNKLINFIVK